MLEEQLESSSSKESVTHPSPLLVPLSLSKEWMQLSRPLYVIIPGSFEISSYLFVQEKIRKIETKRTSQEDELSMQIQPTDNIPGVEKLDQEGNTVFFHYPEFIVTELPILLSSARGKNDRIRTTKDLIKQRR